MHALVILFSLTHRSFQTASSVSAPAYCVDVDYRRLVGTRFGFPPWTKLNSFLLLLFIFVVVIIVIIFIIARPRQSYHLRRGLSSTLLACTHLACPWAVCWRSWWTGSSRVFGLDWALASVFRYVLQTAHGREREKERDRDIERMCGCLRL